MALMIVISGCKPGKGTDLCGKWVAEYPFGMEILELYPNGEYSQEVNVVVDGNRKYATNKGHWIYDLSTKNLKFENPLIVVNGFGEMNKDYDKPIHGILVTPVTKNFILSNIRICINPDCGYYYVKVNDSKSTK